MKTIYLHIGLGKTGTTTIQKYMGHNFQVFLEHGLHYIQSSGGIHGAGHQSFAKSFIHQMPGYMQAPVNDVSDRNAVIGEIRECKEDNILLSSENFQLADPERVKDFLDNIGLELQYKIILFVRSQDELAESEYNQMVKVRKEKRTFYSYVKSEFDGDFMRLASRWGKTFGESNIICKIYNAKGYTVLADFFTCLPENIKKVKSTLPSIKGSSNKSLGYAQLMIKRMLNILQSSEADNEHVELPDSFREIFETIDIPPLLMNSAEARKFRKIYQKSNKKFNKRYLGKKSSELGGSRYSDDERNQHFQNCKDLANIFSIKGLT
ncbi:MAG: hypothetical protein JKY19_02235 [Alcanivoracaceae bacterium]|nr:hypothetical protein [Alcanivoracaceae bacterium]